MVDDRHLGANLFNLMQQVAGDEDGVAAGTYMLPS